MRQRIEHTFFDYGPAVVSMAIWTFWTYMRFGGPAVISVVAAFVMAQGLAFARFTRQSKRQQEEEAFRRFQEGLIAASSALEQIQSVGRVLPFAPVRSGAGPLKN